MRVSIHSLKRKVGHGSREHDFVGDCLIVLRTLSSVTGEKEVKLGGEAISLWEKLLLLDDGGKLDMCNFIRKK